MPITPGNLALRAVVALSWLSCLSCSESHTAPGPLTYRIEIVSGTGQSDTIGARLHDPLVVRVVESSGRPAAGQVVDLEPAAGHGVLSANSITTDADGVGRVTWTLGLSDGQGSVQVTLRDAPATPRTFTATVTLPTLAATALSMGFEHGCAISPSRQLYCWGLNDQGQLGNGTTINRNTAAVVPGAPLVERVSAGAAHTCAIGTDGELYCWGRNVRGQLGDGSTTTRRVPVQVARGLRFSEVAAGAETTCALDVAGMAYCWGLLPGTTSSSHVPVQVSGGVSFTSLVASEREMCGVAVDGNPYCLRPVRNPDGSAGGAGYEWRTESAPSPARRGFAGGFDFMCALDAAGQATCWGANGYGQLGTGDTRPSSGVVPVSGGRVFAALYAGHDWTCGMTPTGPTYCWGHNNSGVIAPIIGQRYVEPTPVLLAVPPGLTFTTIDGGYYHMCGIGSDTRVYCWGGGYNGQLGDAHSTADRYDRPTLAPVVRR